MFEKKQEMDSSNNHCGEGDWPIEIGGSLLFTLYPLVPQKF